MTTTPLLALLTSLMCTSFAPELVPRMLAGTKPPLMKAAHRETDSEVDVCIHVSVGQLSASARAPRDTRDYSNERLTGGAGASLPRVVLVTAEPVVVALPDPTVVGREDDEGLSRA